MVRRVVFVVPKFANLLNETAQLPWLAWAVLSIGVWSNESSGLLAFAVLLLAGGIAVALRNPALRAHALDQLARLPVVREWLKLQNVSRQTAWPERAMQAEQVLNLQRERFWQAPNASQARAMCRPG